MPVFRYSSSLAAPASAVYAWHESPGALERLLPPWTSVRLVESRGGLQPGARVVLRLGPKPLQRRWVANIRECQPGFGFTDEQIEGPFKYWLHRHRFVERNEAECNLEDKIDYRLPYGPAGTIIAGAAVRSQLERTFRFRHRRTADDIRRHRAFANRPKLAFAVSGASGLIGTELVNFLRSGGHRVHTLVRRRPRDNSQEIFWDPTNETIDARALEGIDVVVHLAGANIAASHWTTERKRAIVASRVQGTGLLCRTLAESKKPPAALIAASAVGYYGNRGADRLDEESEHGAGFLSETCRAWEQATEPASKAGIRVVNLRIGVVLSARAGALARMLTPFRLGAGGILGDGRQFVPWIALDDLVGVVQFLAYNPELHGPVNAVAPTPVTNRVFTKALGRVLKRPTLLPLPAAAVRLAFGEMGDELLLSGCRALPDKLERTGFAFLHPEIEQALEIELGRGSSRLAEQQRNKRNTVDEH